VCACVGAPWASCCTVSAFSLPQATPCDQIRL
jgi:hypothetical protein